MNKCNYCKKETEKYFCSKKCEEKRKIEVLASHLEGLANSLRKGWIPFKGVLGNLLIHLESNGYLKKEKLYYVRELE